MRIVVGMMRSMRARWPQAAIVMLAAASVAAVDSCASQSTPPGPTIATGGATGGSAGRGGTSGSSGSTGTGGASSGGSIGTGGGTPSGGGQAGAQPGGDGGGAGGAIGTGGTPGSGGSAGPDAAPPGGGAKASVLIFMIDGLQADAAKTAAANGATNLKMIMEAGVTVADAHSTSSAARTTLTNGSLPWGNATSGNIAVHTGTHLYEAGPAGMDDIFLAARAAGIKSVFSGGDNNYAGLTTADFHYASTASSDQAIVQNVIGHVKTDQVRLMRVHLQRLRDDWSGPAGKTDPNSPYLRHIVANDALLGQLIQALKDAGTWDSTLLIVTADHGMGQATSSSHLPSVRSSWDIFMGFYGAGVKKGATIPYAELPDVAVTAAKFLGLPALRGHTGAGVDVPVKGATGTALGNIFVGAPDDLVHPRYVEQYLKLNTYPMSGDDYQDFRAGMIKLLK
jgi:hypothetical protein